MSAPVRKRARLSHDLQSARAARRTRRGCGASWSASIDREWLEPLCRGAAAAGRGARLGRAWRDGLDEIADHAAPRMSRCWRTAKSPCARSRRKMPACSASPLADTRRRRRRRRTRPRCSALLDGETGAYRDIVLLNSAAALIVGGKARRSDAKACALAAQAHRQRRGASANWSS